jgi:hypothetical protein
MAPLLKVVGIVALVIAAGVIGYVIRGTSGKQEREQAAVRTFTRPSDPPPEYLYLDSARALAYLGQIEDGLTSGEKRSLQITDSVSGKLSAGGAEAGGSTERVGTVEQDVTASSTDRFYRLLGALIDGWKERKWLYTVDARIEGDNTVSEVLKDLEPVKVGDFVRVTRGRVYLAPYAAVYPKASYALSYLGGDLTEPLRPLFAPVTSRERKALRRYRHRVGANPRMPLVLPTLNAERSNREVVELIVPVRYRGLTSEPSSLAGDVTVVGKVIYKDLRRTTVSPDDPNQPIWVDRQTIREFGPALRRASRPLLRLLRLEGVKRSDLIDRVRRSVTFDAPVVVVLPVAIYQ